jgi:tRNA A37 threonylcarbamoyladenosine dehydratase
MRDGGFLINDFWRLRFEGINRLYGTGSIERLAASHVVVVGLGGVGSWTVEALARSGVGSLSLVDLDEICISNTNRQVHALSHTVGSSKASALAERLALINPDCAVCVCEEWLSVDGAGALIDEEILVARARLQAAARAQAGPVPDVNIDGAGVLPSSRGAFDLWLTQIDPARSMPPPAPAVTLLPNLAVVDAIDNYADKAALLAACARRRVRCVSVGGAGGLTDPTMIRVADLTAAGSSLLKQTRGEMRRRHGFPAGSPRWNTEWGIRAVYSIEAGRAARLARPKGGKPAAGQPRADCDRFGTACFATGAVGFVAAAEVVNPLATAAAPPPAFQGLSEGAFSAGTDPKIAGRADPERAGGADPEMAGRADPEMAGGADPGMAGGADPRMADEADAGAADSGSERGGSALACDAGEHLPSYPVSGDSWSEVPATSGAPRSGQPRMCAAGSGRSSLDGRPAMAGKATVARGLWPGMDERPLAGRTAVGSDASPWCISRSPAAPRPLAGARPPPFSSHRLLRSQLRRRSSVRLIDETLPGAALDVIAHPPPRVFDSHSHCHAVPTRTDLPFSLAPPPSPSYPSPPSLAPTPFPP